MFSASRAKRGVRMADVVPFSDSSIAETVDRQAATATPAPSASPGRLTQQQVQWLRQKACAKDVDNVIAEEFAASLGLAELIRSRDVPIEDAFDRLQFIFDCLDAEKPRLILAQHERVRLQVEVYRLSGTFGSLMARIAGGSSPATVIVALVCSLVIWTILVLTIHLLTQRAVSDLAEQAFFMNGRVLLVVTSAAFIGGILSIATRLQQFADVHDLDPFSMFWTAMLKPLIGVAVSLFMLATLAGGVVSFGFLGADPLQLSDSAGSLHEVKNQTLYVLWMLGFLCGFSERFAWDFVSRAEGVASGGASGDPKVAPPSRT
jgi:hypothetical protein